MHAPLRSALVAGCCLLGSLVSITAVAQSPEFTHPGILHSQANLDRIRSNVAAEVSPWIDGLSAFTNNSYSRSNYSVRGGDCAVVTRGGSSQPGNTQLWNDANAAYQNALMWSTTGNAAHAEKSKQILNAWSSSLQTINGPDAILAAGLYGFKLVNAAEILNNSYAGWSDAENLAAGNMFRNVFYPVVEDFATFANGNWDGAAMKMMIATGVYLDDRAMFDRATNYFLSGSGNGRVTHYVINEEGQAQESGRDQAHTQLGLGLLAEVAEIAWQQGVDLWSAYDNRLLKGFEYTAKYNLGNDAPFMEFTDTTGKYHHTQISTSGRGEFRAVWEMAYNHYVRRMGLEMPWTEQLVEGTSIYRDWNDTVGSYRAEGPGFQADHPGFGTLLFSLPGFLPGDYDENGVVDQGDYLVWRESFGSTNLAADGNFDGIIDAADYTVWRDSFGQSSGLASIGNSKVPEPHWTTLIGLSLIGCLLGWRRAER